MVMPFFWTPSGAMVWKATLRAYVRVTPVSGISPQAEEDGDVETLAEMLSERLAEALPVTLAEMLPEGIPEMLTEGTPEMLTEGIPDMLPEWIPDGLPEWIPDGLPTTLAETLPEIEDDDPYGGNPSTGRWGQSRSPH
jgi:hypothetical protein